MAKPFVPAAVTAAQKLAEHDRRVWARFPCENREGRAVDVTTQRGWWARVRDISSHGIGFTVKRPFDVGSTIVLEVQTSATGNTILEARVVHATPEAGNQWRIGCELLVPLSDADVQAFLHGQ
jgi:hypothetical protein